MRRRQALKLLATGAASACLSHPLTAAPKPSSTTLTREDDAFLDDMERRGCLYFAEQAGEQTGQVLDRAAAANKNGDRDSKTMSSIAATGFGLTALCVAHKRGYQSRSAILEQVHRTLRYHCEVMPHEHGFYYHFNDLITGEPWRNVEVSSIDTSILLCGVLTARAYFHRDPEIVSWATRIYERVDWPWMLNGAQTFSMGWHRDKGFLQAHWSHYCELMMIYLLALGSPTHPIDPSCWTAWTRPVIHYESFEYISGNDPLFTHQYSHAWFDFRGKRDQHANYFINSVTATRAHKAFCLSLGSPYSPDYWGISASDSQHGYTAWGGPPRLGRIDGSVVPCATAGSLPFLPTECLRVLSSLKDKHGSRAYGRYGFCDAFHPETDWYDSDVLGIDLGIGILMAENLRSNFVWETFARNPGVDVAMRKASFRAT